MSGRGRAMGWGVLLLVVATAPAACGGGGSDVVSPPSRTPAATASPTPSPSASPAASVHPVVTVVPATGLRDKQQVTVAASGFSPNEALQVIECADKGKATSAGDCNLAGMVSVSSDASGRLSVPLQVLRGPFGANNVRCSVTQRCLVSVTQASLSPTEEADAPIVFAG